MRIQVERAGYKSWRLFHITSFISGFISDPSWAGDSAEALGHLRGCVFVIYQPKDGIIAYDDSTHKQLVILDKVKHYSCLELKEKNLEAEFGPYPLNREFTNAENEIIVDEKCCK